MRVTINLFLFVAISTACFNSNGFSQNPELILSHSFTIDEIEFAELKNFSNSPSSGNMLAINEERALLQIGYSDLMLIELDSGRIEKKIDMIQLLQWVTESLHEHWGEEYCVPGRESFRGRVKPENYAIRFDRILKYSGNNQFATLTHSVVLNEEDDHEREIFVGLLVFNENLEILGFHALKGYEELNSIPALIRDGFFHNDHFFTRFLGGRFNLDFDFMMFEKNSRDYYQMIDTMDHWPEVELFGEPFRRFTNIVEREDGLHLPMGKSVFILKNWSEGGIIRELPLDSNQYIFSMETLGPDDWSVTWVVNRTWALDGDPMDLTAYLSLIEPPYRRFIHLENYNLYDWSFRSMSKVDKKIYLLLFNNPYKRFKVEVFDFVEK